MQYVKNEWMKMWSQKNAWIMFSILIVILALVAGINKYYDDDSSTKEARLAANEKMMEQYEQWAKDGTDAEGAAYYQEGMMKVQYRIDHDLPSESAVTFAEHMDISLSLTITFVGIFTVVIAAGIVSNEFSTGTIKMLLTRPVARWKILLSKLITSLLYSVVLLTISVLFTFILGYILFNIEDVGILSVVDGQVVSAPIETSYVSMIGYSFVSIVMTTIFAFMMGSLFGSSTLAVSLSLLIILMGNVATAFLSNYEFAKYLWFANDLSQYINGGTPFISDLTLSFSIIVNLVYAIVFLAITFGYFIRRNITA